MHLFFKILIIIVINMVFRSILKKLTRSLFIRILKVINFLNNLLLLDGMIYFVEGKSVGSDFGFPRVELKKHFRWFTKKIIIFFIKYVFNEK